MDILKKIFPLSFRFASDVASLVIGIIIHVVVGIVVGVLVGIVGLLGLPLLGILTGLVSSLVGVYITGGIVIEILVFAKVIKVQ